MVSGDNKTQYTLLISGPLLVMSSIHALPTLFLSKRVFVPLRGYLLQIRLRLIMFPYGTAELPYSGVPRVWDNGTYLGCHGNVHTTHTCAKIMTG